MASEPTDLVRAVDTVSHGLLAIFLADELEAAERREAEANATIEARDEALMRAGRDNVRLYSTIDHIRFIAQGLDASCTEEVLAALEGAPDPRRVETVEELDALPVGTLVRDEDGDYWIKHTNDPETLGYWRHWQGAVTNAPTVFSLSGSRYLTVLWLPEGES